MSTQIQTARSTTEKRAIELLGSGLSAATVATAIGVSESRISQLMAQKDFADEVATIRFQNLQKHNEMDNAYDRMEKKVATQLEEMLPLMTRPMELLKAASVINGMKRRGSSAPEQMVNQNQVVQLLMPTVITQKFTTNVNNQVIHAGNQTLETIQGSQLLAAAKAKSQVVNEHGAGLHNQSTDYVETKAITHSNNSPRASIELIQQRVSEITKSAEATRSEQDKGNGTAAVYEPTIGS
jgi:plasmid maintenance system antidote protein VapI